MNNKAKLLKEERANVLIFLQKEMNKSKKWAIRSKVNDQSIDSTVAI